jgi:hypothetical protein
MGDPALQYRVRLQADGVAIALGFKKLIEFRQGVRGVAPEQTPLRRLPIPRDHRLQHRAPVMGARHVARPQGAAFQVTELIEDEQRMIAGAGEVAVIGRSFLVAVGRAHARIHVEHDGLCRTA